LPLSRDFAARSRDLPSSVTAAFLEGCIGVSACRSF
jgi:hypothetical protein